MAIDVSRDEDAIAMELNTYSLVYGIIATIILFPCKKKMMYFDIVSNKSHVYFIPFQQLS